MLKKINLENALILFAGFGIIMLSYFLRSSNIGAILHPSSLLIVAIGTLCATCLNFSFSEVIKACICAKKLFVRKVDTSLRDIELLAQLVKFARKNGILALNGVIGQVENEFLRKCLKVYIDENSADAFEKNLRTYVMYENKKDYTNIEIFEELGGYAPTFGIVGAIIGLIQVTSTTNNINALLPGLATAFCATLWGLALANLVFLPISGNFKNELKEKVMFQDIVVKSFLGLYKNKSSIEVNDDLEEYVARNCEYKNNKHAFNQSSF